MCLRALDGSTDEEEEKERRRLLITYNLHAIPLDFDGCCCDTNLSMTDNYQFWYLHFVMRESAPKTLMFFFWCVLGRPFNINAIHFRIKKPKKFLWKSAIFEQKHTMAKRASIFEEKALFSTSQFLFGIRLTMHPNKCACACVYVSNRTKTRFDNLYRKK